MSAVDDRPSKILAGQRFLIAEIDTEEYYRLKKKSEFMDKFARDLGVKAGMFYMKQQEAKK